MVDDSLSIDGRSTPVDEWGCQEMQGSLVGRRPFTAVVRALPLEMLSICKPSGWVQSLIMRIEGK